MSRILIPGIFFLFLALIMSQYHEQTYPVSTDLQRQDERFSILKRGQEDNSEIAVDKLVKGKETNTQVLKKETHPVFLLSENGRDALRRCFPESRNMDLETFCQRYLSTGLDLEYENFGFKTIDGEKYNARVEYVRDQNGKTISETRFYKEDEEGYPIFVKTDLTSAITKKSVFYSEVALVTDQENGVHGRVVKINDAVREIEWTNQAKVLYCSPEDKSNFDSKIDCRCELENT